jgi:ATP-binding cassette subfamily F protein uup
MALLLSCEKVGKSFGARMLFRDITLSVAEGERIGMVGPNGAGKSTLLKMLAGLEPTDEGSYISKRGLRLAYVAQDERFDEGATVLSTLAPEGEADRQTLTRASILAGKLGFADAEQPAAELSGGWRKRLSIARALMIEPELLLLDEPTNHLDLEGILWLERFLASAPFSFLMISHDRFILENSVNRLIELSTAYPDGFLSVSGNYSEFLQRREEFLVGQRSQEQALAGKARRELEWLKRGAKARTTKAKGRIEEAGRVLDDLAATRQRNAEVRRAEIDFTATGRQTRKLVTIKGAGKSLGGRPLFSGLDLVLAPGAKVGVVGPNGSGKTTLLKLISGQLPPDTGEVRFADELRIVYFQQDRASLDRSQTLAAALGAIDNTIIYRDRPMHITSWAKRFLFRSEQLDQPVSLLSGGEQSRVLIARLMQQPADVLILDEPTNDLDIPSLEVLEESLEEFPGALILVTHDRFMISRLSDVIVGLDGVGGVGMYADVTQWETAWRAAAADHAARLAKSAAPTPSKAQRSDAAPAEKPRKARLSWKEQRELEGMEAAVLGAEAAVAALEAHSHDPEITQDHRRAHDHFAELSQAQDKVRALYARWAELEGKLAGA